MDIRPHAHDSNRRDTHGWISRLIKAGLAATLLCVAPLSQAGPFLPSPLIGAVPGDGPPAPPDPHPGKEYTDEVDKNASEPPMPDPGRIIRWDGAGGRTDSTKFTPDTTLEVEIDAMANSGDALFDAVVADETPMAFSLRAEGGGDIEVPIWYETTGASGGVRAHWASMADVDQEGVRNLDALEIWGSDSADDANRISLLLDAAFSVSIFNLDGSPYLFFSDLVTAMQPLLGVEEPDIIDIDALMVQDRGAIGEFDDGDRILFSLWPAEDPLSDATIAGDAVWLWAFGSAPEFLVHGGHRWESGWLGENVDAIEALAARTAVPEPASFAMLALGLAWLLLGMPGRDSS